MAASTISRATWVDGASGTLVTNARLHSDIYAPIDALIANNITFGGTVSAEGFGTHNFAASGTGGQLFLIRNSAAGAANFAGAVARNDASVDVGLRCYSSTFTPAGDALASGGQLYATGAGGLSVSALDSAGDIRLYTRGTTLRATVNNTGIVAENTFGFYVRNTGANPIPVGQVTAGNDLEIGTDNGANLDDTIIAAGAEIRFRTASAERVVVDSNGHITPANNVRSGDITLENDFIITEHDKVGYGAPAVAICRPGDKQVVAIIDAYGDLWLKGRVRRLEGMWQRN